MLGAVGRISPDTLSIWRMQGLTKAGGLARWPCEPELQPLTTGRRTGSASASTPAASSKRTGRRPGKPTGSNASGPPYAARPGRWCWPRTASAAPRSRISQGKPRPPSWRRSRARLVAPSDVDARRSPVGSDGSLPQPATSATGYFRAYQSTTLGCCFTASTKRSNLRKAPNTSVGM